MLETVLSHALLMHSGTQYLVQTANVTFSAHKKKNILKLTSLFNMFLLWFFIYFLFCNRWKRRFNTGCSGIGFLSNMSNLDYAVFVGKITGKSSLC